MIVGAAELATAAVLGWEALPNDIKQTLTIIGLAVSAALLVLGACLTFTGAAIPLGIALLVLGAAGLVATAKIGWNTMSDKVKKRTCGRCCESCYYDELDGVCCVHAHSRH